MTNVIKFYDETKGLVDEGREVDVIYHDFSKAFDPVFHNIHIEKLLRYRLGEQTMRWTKNRLNRQALRVVTSGTKFRQVISGASQ